MKDTIRILITLKCNLSCGYCCNNLDSVKSKFRETSLFHILKKLPQYENVCITGGEPFLRPHYMHVLIEESKRLGKKVFLYTNGLATVLKEIVNIGEIIDGLNIGVHGLNPFEQKRYKAIFRELGQKARFSIEDCNHALLSRIFNHEANIKPWKRDVCDTPNEDIYLLEE